MNAPERLASLAAVEAGRAIAAAAARREWILTIRHSGESSSGTGWIERVHVVESGTPPEADELVPAGEELLRVDVLTAERLEALPTPQRAQYRSQYAALLRARRARALGKRVDEMVSWVDYDPITMEAGVYRWVRGERP